MNLIGIDGGGTKTAAVLFDETGRLFARHVAGPCNPNLLGLEASVAVVKECVGALTGGGRNVHGIYIGTAGIFRESDGPNFSSAVAGACGVERVLCENDVMNVIASATDEDRCVAGVSGTGMIVYARESGRITRLGGWGYLLARSGSGYDLGRDAIVAALKETEGLGPKTDLTRLVEQRAGMGIVELTIEVYKREPSFVASFAPEVFEAEAEGDAVARGILMENVRTFAELLNHASATYDCGDTVVVSGGIAERRRFSELLAQELSPGLRLVVPAYPQALGACFNCAKLCGVDTPKMRARLIEEYGKC